VTGEMLIEDEFWESIRYGKALGISYVNGLKTEMSVNVL
jgi:hypothetical protein